jgi:hypothetical protein
VRAFRIQALLFTKTFAGRVCLVPRWLKFITLSCGTIRSLKSTSAGSFIFDLHRKFLFWDFAATLYKGMIKTNIIQKQTLFKTNINKTNIINKHYYYFF